MRRCELMGWGRTDIDIGRRSLCFLTNSLTIHFTLLVNKSYLVGKRTATPIGHNLLDARLLLYTTRHLHSTPTTSTSTIPQQWHPHPPLPPQPPPPSPHPPTATSKPRTKTPSRRTLGKPPSPSAASHPTKKARQLISLSKTEQCTSTPSAKWTPPPSPPRVVAASRVILQRQNSRRRRPAVVRIALRHHKLRVFLRPDFVELDLEEWAWELEGGKGEECPLDWGESGGMVGFLGTTGVFACGSESESIGHSIPRSETNGGHDGEH